MGEKKRIRKTLETYPHGCSSMKKSSGIKEALKRALDESVAEFELMQQKKKESERKEEFDSNAKQERKKKTFWSCKKKMGAHLNSGVNFADKQHPTSISS